MIRFIDHGEDGDEIRAEDGTECLSAEDLFNIMDHYRDYGGGEYLDNLAVRVSVPGSVSGYGLRSARLIKDEKGDWVLHLVTEGTLIP